MLQPFPHIADPEHQSNSGRSGKERPPLPVHFLVRPKLPLARHSLNLVLPMQMQTAAMAASSPPLSFLPPRRHTAFGRIQRRLHVTATVNYQNARARTYTLPTPVFKSMRRDHRPTNTPRTPDPSKIWPGADAIHFHRPFEGGLGFNSHRERMPFISIVLGVDRRHAVVRRIRTYVCDQSPFEAAHRMDVNVP